MACVWPAVAPSPLLLHSPLLQKCWCFITCLGLRGAVELLSLPCPAQQWQQRVGRGAVAQG